MDFCLSRMVNFDTLSIDLPAYFEISTDLSSNPNCWDLRRVIKVHRAKCWYRSITFDRSFVIPNGSFLLWLQSQLQFQFETINLFLCSEDCAFQLLQVLVHVNYGSKVS